MSFASYTSQARRYREMEVSSAAPGHLVVMVYDHLLSHLAKVRLLLGAEDIAPRSDALQVCRDALAELLVALDRERGGDLATHLAAIYSFLLGELATLGLRPEASRLDRITKISRDLRDAFAEAARIAPPVAAGG